MNTVTGTNIRFAQFNASLNRNADGQLINDLSNPAIADNRAIGDAANPNRNQALRIQQAKNAAEIIQRNNPDVLLINEFDFNTANPTKAVELFINNFLKVGQNGAAPVDYKYFYIAPSNTGIPSGFDLNNNGSVVTTLTDGIGDNGYGDDSFGFGNFPGQFGMVVLSKYEIDTPNVRTFQNFLWKDMPGGLLTNDPTVDNPATPVNENLNGFYSAAEIEKLRLSSKSHWDVPIKVDGGKIVHALVSHPTPPVFDGTEDRNGKRNADEIRFWADYVSPGQGGYIYDDKGGKGGIAGGSSFVIMGDQNADPRDGDSYKNAVNQLLGNPNINTNSIPTSAGGVQQSTLQGLINNTQTGNPAFDTADFADSGTNPGNLRTDYVLPSADLAINNSGVFWPLNTDPTFAPVGVFNAALPGGYATSDHRLVFADVQVGATPSSKSIVSAGLIGQKIFATGLIPTGAAGKINGVDVPLGGLSGVTYDAAKNQYYAISDDRTPDARFYTFTLNPVTSDVTFTNVVQLKDASGKPFALNSLDPEGIALTQNGTVWISSEGEANPAVGRVSNPFIKEFSLTTGTEIRSLAVPTKFLPKVTDTNGNGIVDAADTQTAGIRNNAAFESLTITPDKKTLYTATENSLFQDGTVATATTGTNSRIVQYNLVTGQPEKEYIYQTDRVALAPIPTTAFATNGLVDLLAIDDRGTALALERSFSTGVPGTGNTIKIYEISLQGASDISAIDSLATLTPAQLAALQPVQKRLVLNLDDLKLSTGLDNVEGITFGPKLADGRQSIVLVSDNNFSATQFTQVLTLGADLVTKVAAVEPTPNLVSGTAAADNFIAAITPGFDGISDTVFTGAGNDSVDTPIAGTLAGNNRIDTGSGNDTVFVGNNDRVFGSTGDDLFEAGDATGYRISGGAGNDTLFLGTNGRALGGDGNDKFFVGAGGGNVLSGGAGADQFWIYNGEAPTSANTIVDYQIGTDVLGITGGVKFTDLIRTGSNIAIGGNNIATLTGVDTTTLTAANFAFI
jgi:3-phytase